MHVIPVYRDLLSGGWPYALQSQAPYFSGLEETYGREWFGPAGVPGLAAVTGDALLTRIADAAALTEWEDWAARCLQRAMEELPGPPPPLYLACLFDFAPGATLSVHGRPSIALGLERFRHDPPTPPPRHHYHPSELVEIVPHEAAHAARMQGLGLPPTPRLLPLKEMLMLEGTALLLTDQLLGRQSLRTFMPADMIASHQAWDPYLRQHVVPCLESGGMDAFHRFFSAASPVSGYYLGWSLCSDYLQRSGRTLAELILTPADEVLRTLELMPTGGAAGP